MIVCFTGTGNSLYCAQWLAGRLGDRVLNCHHFIRDGIAAELISDRPWVFVCPTYAWRIPRIFEDFLRSGTFEGSRKAWFVMTCGSDIGAAGRHLAALCRDKGLEYQGVLEVVMPENYTAMFPVPGEAEAKAIIARAEPVLEEGLRQLEAGQPFEPRRESPADVLKSGPVNAVFYRCFVRAGAFRAGDACTGCGRCASVCPLQNIRLEQGRPVWGKHCTHCMACINGCPAKAIEYGKISRGKPRYLAPCCTSEDQNITQEERK